ncbi:MAG: NAD(P)/FAD-dependent oxidoreductase [Planctomycetaceae bacterium]
MIATASDGSHPRLLVIGAGPAGVSAAIRLRDRGAKVLLVDRAHFPRDKVCGCCLNLSALQSLAAISCDRLVSSLAHGSLSRWELHFSKQVIHASLPGGVAISRAAMDAALLEEAIRRGADVRMNCEARITDVMPDAVTVSLRVDHEKSTTTCFDSVVFATGLSGGGVSRWLPFIKPPAGPIGVAGIVDSIEQVAPNTIHMICGREGYVGLVQLEDGRVNLAAAIRQPGDKQPRWSRAEIAARVDALLRSASMPELASQQLERLRMTPPLTRSRQAGWGGLIAVGDAAGYSEPFTGEGMAWAIQTGIEAADCIVDRLESASGNSQTLGTAWSVRYRRLMGRRRWLSRLLAGSLRSPVLAPWLVQAMRIAPWTIEMAVRRLNRLA